MQISRSYQALVHHLRKEMQASDDVPCVLLWSAGCVKALVEITDCLLCRLTSHSGSWPVRVTAVAYDRREKRLAQVLSFMRKVILRTRQCIGSMERFVFPLRRPSLSLLSSYSTDVNPTFPSCGLSAARVRSLAVRSASRSDSARRSLYSDWLPS